MWTRVVALLTRLRFAWSRRRLDRETQSEFDAHLGLLVDRYLRAGMSAEDAHVAARRQFGNITLAREQVYNLNSIQWVEGMTQDVRYAVRQLRRSPVFASVVVATLALGIGVTTAVFSVVSATLLRPLPYQDSERLVRILEHVPAEAPGSVAEVRPQMNEDEFAEWRRRTRTLSHMAAYASRQATLTTRNGAERTTISAVSPALFPMLAVRPRLGRGLIPDDERPAADVVVLSESAWRRYFASDPAVLERPAVLDGRTHRVVGVMPAAFDFPSPATEFWTAYSAATPSLGRDIDVLARLGDGATLGTATREANAIARDYRQALRQDPESPPSERLFEVRRMQDYLVERVRPALRVLSVAAALVLLIVCANVANLQLARGISRQRDVAVRRAIGASGFRIVRQGLVEGGVLALAGGIGGVAIAYVSVDFIRWLAGADVPELFQLADRASFDTSAIIPRLNELRVDTGVLLFALFISVSAGLVFGLVPTLRSSFGPAAQRLHQMLRSRGAGAATDLHGRLGGALVVAQIVLATTLMIGAGLLIHSFAKLTAVNTGYDPRNVLMFQVVPPSSYPVPRKSALAHDLVARLQQLPYVNAAGFTNLPPLAGGFLMFGIFVPEGRTLEEMKGDPGQPQARAVSNNYLRAIGVRLVEGRWLDEKDVAGQPRVMLVTSAVARRYFNGRSPLLAQVRLLPSEEPWQIVGVVEDVRQGKFDEEFAPQFFVTSEQALVAMPHLPELMRAEVALGFLSFAVRVDGDPSSVISDVRGALRQLDPAAAVYGVTTMQSVVSNSVSRQRFFMVLVAAFAFIAGVLGALGIYGVLAYSVAQRTKEIGTRIALGAGRGNVLQLIMSKGLAMTAAGLAMGLIGAVALTRYLEGMLFGVTTLDPYAYGAVVTGFAIVATLASYVPAARALRIEPLVALRDE